MNTYCKCHNTMSIKEALLALKDEAIELVEEPSKDELSDVMYCINRLAGAIVKRPYLNIVPTGNIHERKIVVRMNEYGCIHSKRHLINGSCPSEINNAK